MVYKIPDDKLPRKTKFATRTRGGRKWPLLTVPEQHTLKIARDTLKMPDAMVGVMGGPDKATARRIIEELTKA